jgi:hypothetical protein
MPRSAWLISQASLATLNRSKYKRSSLILLTYASQTAAQLFTGFDKVMLSVHYSKPAPVVCVQHSEPP